MPEQNWDNFARLNAGERFQRQSSAMGTAATEALVRAAAVEPGMRVLDVACGAGEPALSLAALLSGTGRVIGSDISAGPLEVVRARAAKRELTNVEFVQADVHALPFADASFDRVTCRLGVMFFSDLPRALGEMHRVLRPGGRVALLAWGAMTQPYFAMTVGTVLRLRPKLTVPPAAQAMFKFGVPGTLATALTQAGFAGAADPVVPLCWDWHGSPAELWEYFRAITLPFKPLREAIAGDDELECAVLEEMQKSYDGSRVSITTEMVLATARKP